MKLFLLSLMTFISCRSFADSCFQELVGNYEIVSGDPITGKPGSTEKIFFQIQSKKDEATLLLVQGHNTLSWQNMSEVSFSEEGHFAHDYFEVKEGGACHWISSTNSHFEWVQLSPTSDGSYTLNWKTFYGEHVYVLRRLSN